MNVIETGMALALPMSLLVGLIWGRRQRKHRHTWTMWSRIWDDEKQELTQVQERMCKTCGFREEHDPRPKSCPPHDWGKWTVQNVTIRGESESLLGQGRHCNVCGVKVLRRTSGVA